MDVPSPTTPAPTAAATLTVAPSATASATATTAPTDTPVPTDTPAATDTPAPTDTPLPSATPSASATHTAVPATPRPVDDDFTPTAVSVWDTAFSGGDNMSGSCSAAVTPVYGLVQISPLGDTLKWRNQEPSPYLMTKVRASVWQYSGPTSINDGTVTMVVQFTSAKTLVLTRTFVSNAEPNCTHVHNYTGTFRNLSP